MYTELVFAAKLKDNTPVAVILTLKYMLGEAEIPDNLTFDEGFFNAGSFYFPVSQASNSFFYDGENWVLSHRGNYKDHDEPGFITLFLKWIKPYIESGSGLNDIYAITISEEGVAPIIYTLEG